jgi:hypothetical protein
MSLLNIVKGETITSLEAQLSKLQTATNNAIAGRSEARTSLVDVNDRLATATLYQSDSSALLVEHDKITQRLKAFDLAEAKGQAEIAKLGQKLAALKNKEARQQYADGVLKLADQLEKCLPAFRKSARAISDVYLAIPEAARDEFTGAVGAVLADNVLRSDAFASGDVIEAAVVDMRRHATMIVDGSRDLPANNVTLGERLESFGRKRAVA